MRRSTRALATSRIPGAAGLSAAARLSILLLVALTQLGSAAELSASDSRDQSCDSAIYHQFDFWLGDWQVFDRKTMQLVAFDHIEKQFDGCAVIQHMTWLTDQFRRRGAAHRLAGMSLNAVSGGQWVALWVDNNFGEGLLVTGGLQQDGSIALTTPAASAGQYTRGVWTSSPDGTVRNVGYHSKDGKTGWVQYFDYLYRANR